MSKYSKSIWAALSTLVGAVTTAVAASDPHTLAAVDTLGWLGVAATVLGVTGGVYGLPNRAEAPPRQNFVLEHTRAKKAAKPKRAAAKKKT